MFVCLCASVCMCVCMCVYVSLSAVPPRAGARPLIASGELSTRSSGVGRLDGEMWVVKGSRLCEFGFVEIYEWKRGLVGK